MKKIIPHAMLLLLCAAAVSCGDTTADSKKTAENANEVKIDSAKSADDSTAKQSPMADMKPDAEFAVTAADGGMLEVQLGKMAGEKAVSAVIKKLGAMMVKDHSKANEELMAAAKAKNITLPGTLSDKCQKMVADLQEKKGADFDKAYADLMVSDHKEDIDEFTKEAEKGNDPELSAWAKSKIPVLQHHLAMAEEAKKMTSKK